MAKRKVTAARYYGGGFVDVILDGARSQLQSSRGNSTSTLIFDEVDLPIIVTVLMDANAARDSQDA